MWSTCSSAHTNFTYLTRKLAQAIRWTRGIRRRGKKHDEVLFGASCSTVFPASRA
jgi:hypothetical protein